MVNMLRCNGIYYLHKLFSQESSFPGKTGSRSRRHSGGGLCHRYHSPCACLLLLLLNYVQFSFEANLLEYSTSLNDVEIFDFEGSQGPGLGIPTKEMRNGVHPNNVRLVQR